MFEFLKNARKESEIPQCHEDTPNIVERGVGEPVISFVKLLEEHPENFLWKRDCPLGTSASFGAWYKLLDKKNKKLFKYYVSALENEVTVLGLPFLTEQERQYLLEAHNRLSEMVFQARKDAMRQEYIDIYCKEQQ